MMVRGVRADRQRKAMFIDNRMIFTPFPRFVGPMLSPPPFGRRKRCINESLRFIQHLLIPQCIGRSDHDVADGVVVAPALKAPMDGFVVRVALRQHVPLRTCVQNPEYGFENFAGGKGVWTRPISRAIFFGNIAVDLFPVVVRESQHGEL